jgi:PEP-CTERM motif
VNAYLYGDASGSPDNASQIFLGSGTPTAPNTGTTNSVVSIALNGTIPVSLGSTYWLVLKPSVSGGFFTDLWNYSSPAITGMVDLSTNDSTWTSVGATLPAFRLTAVSASVPEPSTFLILLLGAVVLVLQRKRHA